MEVTYADRIVRLNLICSEASPIDELPPYTLEIIGK